MSDMEISELLDFILVMLEEIQEEKIWYMWNHTTFREGTYKDFRAKILNETKTPEQKQKEIEDEEQRGLDISNAILGWGGESSGII